MKVGKKITVFNTESFVKMNNTYKHHQLCKDSCTFRDIFQAHRKVCLGGGEEWNMTTGRSMEVEAEDNEREMSETGVVPSWHR